MKLFLIVSIWTLAGMAYSDWWSGTFRIAAHCLLGDFNERVTGDVIKSSYRINAGFYGSPTYTIKYRYYVDAQVYTSNVISCETFTHKPKQRLREYPVAHDVTVYYDPSFPQFSVLERRSDIAGSVYGQITLCLVIIPIFTFFLAHYVFKIGKIDDENET